MSVSPDVLLKAQPGDGRAKMAKTAAVAESGGRNGPSFDRVYARQQARPVERQEGPARPQTERRDEVQDQTQAAAAHGDGRPAVADDGNPLPTDAAQQPDDDGELDPLLLLGMTGQFVPIEVDKAPVADGGLTLTDEAPELDPLSVPSGTDEARAAKQKVAPQPAEFGLEAEAADDPGKGFAGMLLASGKKLAERAEATLEGGAEEGLDGLAGAREGRSATAESSGYQGLNQLPATQAVRPPPPMGVPLQLQHAGWSEAVVDRVMWLSSQNLKSADIQLDPQELGRMEVRIEMHREQTQITFLSPHAGVRDALEGQMQRLREMFNQQGMDLLDVNVSDQSQGGEWQGSGDDGKGAGQPQGESSLVENGVARGVNDISTDAVGGARGLVDYYA